MRNATKMMVSTFGSLVALAGLEHGIGEIRQGNVAPDGMVFRSWPGPGPYDVLNGEPALTVIPNLLVSGALAILVSLAFLAWVTVFVERKRAGLALAFLCVVMLLVGGGFGPPILGLVVAAVATKINTSLRWWRAHLPDGWQHTLATWWPWTFGACLINWLMMLAGLVVLDYFFGVDNTNLTLVLLLGMFGLLFLTIVAGFAHDIERGTRSTANRELAMLS